MSLTPPKIDARISSIDLGFTSSTKWTAWEYQQHALIVSENHKRLKGTDYGGPFLVQHALKQVDPSEGRYSYSFFGSEQFNSRFIPSAGSFALVPSLPTLASWSTEQSTLYSKGATGFKRARPGNPVANAGQWLAELRDLPTLPLRLLARLRNFRALGSEYLNVQFGWKPFVGDLIKMYQLYQQLDKHLAQIARDNKRAIRRRRTISDTTDSTSTTSNFPTGWGAFFPAPPTGIGATFSSSLTTQVVTKEKIWFVGSFQYYIPDVGSSQWTRRATAALFGLNPTPSLLWEVLPWSWLIGYFSNVGDAISNASSNAVDNLVANYAYVMRQTSVTTTYTAVGTAPSGSFGGQKWSGGTFSSTGSTLLMTKSRARASPYGFGVEFGSLSAYQLSILGALGLSRSRF